MSEEKDYKFYINQGIELTNNGEFDEALVSFDKAIELMKSEGIEQYLEIGPGKALTGFIKKS